MNSFASVGAELLNVDNIANACGFSNETGVTLTDGKIQNLERKVLDSLEKLGHSDIDFSLSLEQEPDINKINVKLNSGEVVLAGFSSWVYNRYFKKKGKNRPCIGTLEDIGMDRSPPHYVSLIGLENDTKLGVIDPYCKYTAKKRPMSRVEFVKDNKNIIEVFQRAEFYQKILLNSRMDGIDVLNRELIYSEVILKKGVKAAQSKGKKTPALSVDKDSLDAFFDIEGKTISNEKEGDKVAK